MNNNQKISFTCVALSFIMVFAACKKEDSAQTSAISATTISNSQAVAVAVDSISNDSIYVIGACSHGHHLDSVSNSALPAVIASYLTANYPGYTFQKAFSDKDASGNSSGYVVIILYNGNPVGLKFDAAGNFLKVLEQREGHDLDGKGWHQGGRFNDRDKLHHDTIDINLLPGAIFDYYAANYAGDTLVKAYETRDSGFIVFSTNNGAFVTVFSADGDFVKREQLGSSANRQVAIVTEDALPSVITSYLSTVYPAFVFKQAFTYTSSGALAGYVVCIDANGTRYAVAFDASGTFIRAVTIR